MGSLEHECMQNNQSTSRFAALRHRNFRLFYFGQMISVIGFWMQNVAMAWVILELTNSPFLLGLVTFIQFIPNLLFSLFAGVVIDRFPKRRIVISTQIIFMLLAFVLSILTRNHMLDYWHILFIGSLMGITNALDIPARQSFLVEMVGRSDLSNAIALNSSMFNTARVVGPAVGGVVLAKYGATTCFLVNAISYLCVIFSLLVMDIKKKEIIKQKKDMIAQIKEGVEYILVTPTVFIPMSLLAAISISAMNFGVLVPVFSRSVLEQGPQGYGALVSALGIGSLTGAICLVLFSKNEVIQQRFLWGGAAGLSIFQILLGQMKWYWPSALLLMGAGFSMVSLSASVNSIIQIQVPNELRGRVMSVYSLAFIGLSSVGGMLSGIIAKWFSASVAFTAGGSIALAATVYLLRNWNLENA